MVRQITVSAVLASHDRLWHPTVTDTIRRPVRVTMFEPGFATSQAALDALKEAWRRNPPPPVRTGRRRRH